MKKFLNNSIFDVKGQNYLSLLIIFVPLLNFLSGINFDLHAPSLPAIATYFSAPMSAAKNTITLSLLGFSIGCIVFGTLLDIFGRRRIILLGLFIYTVVSFLALACGTIQELLLVRFLQGFCVSCLSIGCRTIVIDSFTGHDFKIAMLYTSLAFGLGPILAPFIGGILQHYYGWKANFIAYGVVSFILMTIMSLFVSESKKSFAKFSLKTTIINHINILRDKSFFPGILILGLSQVQLLVYTVTGAFLVENVLHHSAIAYGNSALIISCGYLFGTIVNRMLIKSFSIYFLINLGFSLLFLGLLIQLSLSLFGKLDLFTIVFPIIIIGFSQGFIFINFFTCCLGRSSSAPGIATALFTSFTMLIGTLGSNIMSHISVVHLSNLFMLFAAPVIIQFVIFLSFFKKLVKEIE